MYIYKYMCCIYEFRNIDCDYISFADLFTMILPALFITSIAFVFNIHTFRYGIYRHNISSDGNLSLNSMMLIDGSSSHNK